VVLTILELKNHPFFVATIFVVQVNSSIQKPNQLIPAFLKAAELKLWI
jgi:CTP synthase (UTP-ammonia lyase)